MDEYKQLDLGIKVIPSPKKRTKTLLLGCAKCREWATGAAYSYDEIYKKAREHGWFINLVDNLALCPNCSCETEQIG